ncbi:PAS domain-containing sensor histidine kinase [Pararhodospirillum oryzae]|nr:PAS domain S-box protein [Pararhodospirillum oryzae]
MTSWQHLLDDAEMAMALYAEDGALIWVNPALARLSGFPREHLQGRLDGFLYVLEPGGLITGFPEYLPRMAPTSGTATMRCLGGGSLDVSFTAGRTQTPDGIRYLVTVADISDERCLPCRIRDSRERFRQAVDEQPEMLCRCLADTTITFVNQGFASLFDRTPPEMLGLRLRDLTPVDERAALDGHLALFTRFSPMHDLRATLVRPSGRRVHLLWRRRAVFSPDGAVEAFSATARDITTQACLEEQALRTHQLLRDSEERFRLVFDQTPVGMALVDTAGRFVQVNGALTTILDMRADDLLGRLVLDLFPGDRREEDMAWLRACLVPCPEPLPPREHALLTGTGERAWVQTTCSPLGMTGAEPGLFIFHIEDIGRRRAEEEALKQAKDQAVAASQAKSLFLQTMSHELRTPLNAIIGFSEVISGALLGDLGARYREYGADIVSSAHHLLDIINDILDIARIETGTVSVTPELINADALVQESVALLRDRAEAKNLALVVPPSDCGGCLVVADRRALKQILINLLSNAVKFTPAGGTITVRTEWTGGEMRLRVQDTGIGVDPEDQERIFEPFVQAEREKSRHHEGTGLGLPLCRSLAALHGGTLTLNSHPGEGSTFTLTLPDRPL